MIINFLIIIHNIMLFKIVFKNFRSNIRKYILFFTSNVIAVAELFIFWGMNNVVTDVITEPSIMMGVKSDFMIAVSLITVITMLLMIYSMRYYIRLRARDYGTFIVLGMKKRMSYLLLFIEYSIGCVGSLIIGILVGSIFLYGILYRLHKYNAQLFRLSSVPIGIYQKTIGLCLGVMISIFLILLIWIDGRNLSQLMMKEEGRERKPVNSRWLLLTIIGGGFVFLAVKQYKPGTWGYYFSHIYFVVGGILIIAFSGAWVLQRLKNGKWYLKCVLKINQIDSKYQSNILIILMLFVIHFFALSYIGTQMAEILPLDKNSKNYPYDTIWMARQNDEKFSEKIAMKYGGSVKHIRMIRATMFYSQEEIGVSESTYKELTGRAYGLREKEIVVGLEDQNYQKEQEVTDKVLYDLFKWLYIGKFNPNKQEFESSNILKDKKYQYKIKEMHTQNVFGKFVLEDAGEGCEDTVIFSDEYFEKEWERQAKSKEEVSVLELFSFPKDKEQIAWQEIKKYADKNGVKVFQPDDSHSAHAIRYNKTVFLEEQKVSNIFLLASKIFIMASLLVSSIFIMMIKNLSELSSYQRRYEFFYCMGMRKKAQKKLLNFEVESIGWLAMGWGIIFAYIYVLTYAHYYDSMGEKILINYWKYWGIIVVGYSSIQIVIQKIFSKYMYKRVSKKSNTFNSN